MEINALKRNLRSEENNIQLIRSFNVEGKTPQRHTISLDNYFFQSKKELISLQRAYKKRQKNINNIISIWITMRVFLYSTPNIILFP